VRFFCLDIFFSKMKPNFSLIIRGNQKVFMANSPYCFGGINVESEDGWFGFISHDENVKIGDF